MKKLILTIMSLWLLNSCNNEVKITKEKHEDCHTKYREINGKIEKINACYIYQNENKEQNNFNNLQALANNLNIYSRPSRGLASIAVDPIEHEYMQNLKKYYIQGVNNCLKRQEEIRKVEAKRGYIYDPDTKCEGWPEDLYLKLKRGGYL